MHAIVSLYGATTQIFLGVGPMTDGYMLPVEWVVGNATAAGVHIHILNQTGFAHGNCGHPSYQTDALMAASAARQIQTTLGWSLSSAAANTPEHTLVAKDGALAPVAPAVVEEGRAES